MKFYILCGGAGSRLSSDNSFPKPLNYILGVPLIENVLNSIPSDDITIILNKTLADYNFDTVIHHLTNKKITCIYLDRPTRGAVETAYLGIKKMTTDPNEQICFIDNDTIYNFPNELPRENFIGYSYLQDSSKYHPYSFIKMNNTCKISEIVEKQQISDTYSCGIYGFESIKFFMENAYKFLLNHTSGEFYMSGLYNYILKTETDIIGVPFEKGICLGTPSEIEMNIINVPSKLLRICFDIDNTIIKYRLHGQSYSNATINAPIVILLRKLKSLGHTIILYTARGMKSAKQNYGQAMKTVAMETFESLDKNNIPYDEIYFGKPDADIYIDDKAFNPYMNLLKSIGFENLDYSESSENTTNKFNSIRKVKDTVIKTGPLNSMRGEIFFYKAILNTPLCNKFPKYIDSSENTLQLQYVDGFTLFELLKDNLLTEKHIDTIIDNFNDIHTNKEISIIITTDEIYDNYMGKLKKRSLNKNDYPFENTNEILDKIDPFIIDYLKRTQPVSIVHGDPWFSNTLLSRNNELIFLDMKGDIAGKLTTNGDALTDFGKILQSLLGFDYIVNNISWDSDKLSHLREYYISKINFQRKDLYAVTACLIAKTLSFLNVNIECRTKIWGIIEYLVENL